MFSTPSSTYCFIYVAIVSASISGDGLPQKELECLQLLTVPQVPEGHEQAEKLRGDVEAQHGGANASGAQHDRVPAHGQDGGFLATSPFGQFCDHAAGVLLGNSRSVTFIMALINSSIQILIYVFSLSTIINNYDPELHKNNYPQVRLRLFMLAYNVASPIVCVCGGACVCCST